MSKPDEVVMQIIPANPDALSYRCINCRFIRYEAPLDRVDPRPHTPIIPDSVESALNLADILDRKERNGN